ncbi:MAG TPA: rod shape-determining protein MreD, partial [Chloroflexota bacterium]
MNLKRFHPAIFTALWLLPVLAIFQTSVADRFAINGVIPGIMLVVIVNWGILRGTDEGMLWALLGGLCLDVFTSWPFGTNTVALVIVASVVSLGQGTFMRTHVLLPPVTVFAATVLFYLIALFILASTQHSVDFLQALQTAVIPAALYNGALNVLIFPL